MSNTVKILPNYTYKDYVHWEGRWELIEGFPYAMSPAPVPRHQRISVKLSTQFENVLNKCGCTVYQPLDYRVYDDTIIQPDMLIVCSEIKKPYLDFPPALVAEILSPSTALKDRHTKFGIYESQGIKYYLILSPDTEEVEVYEFNEKEKKYELTKKGHDFQYDFSFLECKASIDFKEAW